MLNYDFRNWCDTQHRARNRPWNHRKRARAGSHVLESGGLWAFFFFDVWWCVNASSHECLSYEAGSFCEQVSHSIWGCWLWLCIWSRALTTRDTVLENWSAASKQTYLLRIFPLQARESETAVAPSSTHTYIYIYTHTLLLSLVSLFSVFSFLSIYI